MHNKHDNLRAFVEYTLNDRDAVYSDFDFQFDTSGAHRVNATTYDRNGDASNRYPVEGAAYDPETITGWGKRPYNWEFSAGVQHELLPQFFSSAELAYRRRRFDRARTVTPRGCCDAARGGNRADGGGSGGGGPGSTTTPPGTEPSTLPVEW